MVKIVACALATMLLGSTAQAAITIDSVAVIGNGQSVISLGSIHETALAGMVKLSSGATDFLAFCVDVPHNISTGTGQNLSYTFTKLTSDFNGNTLSTSQISQIFGLAALGRNSSTSANDTGAIQQAIWTIEYPAGSFTARQGFDQARVDYYVALAPTLHASGKVMQSADGHQSFAIAAVPEPATWAMMLTGFGLVGAATRRRRSTVVAA